MEVQPGLEEKVYAEFNNKYLSGTISIGIQSLKLYASGNIFILTFENEVFTLGEKIGEYQEQKDLSTVPIMVQSLIPNLKSSAVVPPKKRINTENFWNDNPGADLVNPAVSEPTNKSTKDNPDNISEHYGEKANISSSSSEQNDDYLSKNNNNEGNTSLTNEVQISDNGPEKSFVVESIVEKKFLNNIPYYLVKWENYSSDYNTWITEDNFDSSKMIKDFNRKLKHKNKRRVEKVFEVEKILGKRIRRQESPQTFEYLVNWVGYDEKFNSWVPEKDFSSTFLIEEFNLSLENRESTPNTPSSSQYASNNCTKNSK